MFGPLVSLVLLASVSVPAPIQAGTKLEYRGNLVAEQDESAATEKAFRLTVLVGESNSEGIRAYWTLDEQGPGGWSWLDHFGRTNFGHILSSRQESKPALLYARPQGTSIVPVLFPLVNLQRELGPAAQWIDGQMEYQVEEAVRLRDRDTWRVAVGNAYGRKRTLWLDQQSQLILAAEESVFIGPGEKHVLRFALVSEEALTAEQTADTVSALDSLIELRSQLGLSPHTKDVKWTPPRLQLIEEALPGLLAKVEDEPLARLFREAAQEQRRQHDRTGAIDSVKNRLLNRPAPRPDLTNLAGAPFDWEQLKGKTIVLHFWDYQDVPLEEPYGQIAYVDFLYRSRKSEQLQVLGVAVDKRLADPETRGAAVRSVKKLQSFMNLSYPILLDAGQTIRQYGDPRVTGAKLPLFVVIDSAGKIVHYHVGIYDVHRELGLEELQRVVTAALDSPG